MVLVTFDKAENAPLARPRVITYAFLAWVLGAVLVVLLGLISLTFPADSLRTQLTDTGGSADAVDSVITVLRTIGILEIVVGLAVGFLAGPTCRRGDPRFRRALTVLSVIFGVVLLGSVTVGFAIVPLLATLGSIFLFVACVLAYRRSAAEWFAA